MYSKSFIEQAIREAVYKVTGIKDLEKDRSLIDRDMNIMPANFLYIFEILEEELRLPVCQIFIGNSYEVMCVENLTNAIYSLQEAET